MESFRSMMHDVFPFFLVSLMSELYSFWYGLKDLFTLHKLLNAKLCLTIKTDDVTSSRKDVDSHRCLQVAQGQMG